MAKRLTRITTRTGDKGSTGLAGGERVPKTGARIAAIGELDELNSVLGVLLSRAMDERARELLLDIQHALFDAGGELAVPGRIVLDAAYVRSIESAAARLNDQLPPLAEFILPGGGEAASLCHLARAVCRRAERQLWRLHETEPLNPHTPVFLNRLSDLLFILARTLARDAGVAETCWQPGRGRRP